MRRIRSCYRLDPDAKCSVEGCGRKVVTKGFCSTHYFRFHKYGDPHHLTKRPNGSGSKSRGYIYYSVNNKKVAAHRIIMAESLGRGLLPEESVHHKNGDRSDNRLVKSHELYCPSDCCNLELWSRSQPSGQRVKDKLEWARKIIKLYK